MKENQLLENKDVRNQVIGRVEVLEQVGELLLLPNTELATTEMVARYYSTENKPVDFETIKSVVKNNREELNSNGYKVYTKENLLGLNFNLKTKRGGFNILDQSDNILGTGSNAGIALFNKRAILNVGMLLRDSEIAKELRSRLLDIVHDSEQGKGNINTIIEEMSEEKQLMLERIEAEMNGNFDEVCVINSKLFALKNKRIKDLEDEVKVITENSLNIKESRKVINRLVRLIAMKDYRSMFGKAYGDLYSKVNYQLGINIKARDKKASQSYIDTLTEEETFKVEKIVRTWANKVGIDIEKELKIG